MRLRLFVVGLCLALTTSFVYAQRPSLPAACEAFFPSELSPKGKAQTIKETDVNKFLKSGTYGQRGNNTRKFWNVVSDRGANAVYSTSTSTSKIDTLGWNQSVTILKIQNNRALVAEGSFRDVDYPKMPINAKCIGWVPMSKLLLWGSCPTDDAGIYQKSLIVHNIDLVQENVQLKLDDRKVFRNPDILSTNNFKLPATNQFFYIMKRDESKKLVLLSSQYSINKGQSDKVLFGWVHENSYISWNQRTCLELTWDESDLRYFQDKNIDAQIYKDKALNQKISHHSFKGRTGRIHGRELRYPLLDDNVKDNNGDIIIYNLSAFKNLAGDIGDDIGLLQTQLESRSHVNICLVIDGTESMRPYYPAIKEAIKDGCKQLINRKVQVALVIYRDKPHKKDGKSYEIEVLKFTNPNSGVLMSWLDTGGIYGFDSSNDKTAEESLYKGIDEGVKLFQGKKDQSNVMIIVGDCGDNGMYPDLTVSSLSQKIIDNDIHLMAFQVMNKTAPAAYGKFQEISKLMRDSYVAYFQKIQTLKPDLNINPRVERIPNEGGFVGVNDAKSNLYIGACRYPLLGQVMCADSLKKNIVTSINQIKDAVQHQLDIIVGKELGLGTQVIDEAWLEKILGPDWKKHFLGYVAYSGYSPRYDKASKREFYKPVLYISREELHDLLGKFETVAELAARPTLDRKPFIDALTALIRSFVPEVTQEKMNQMTMSEVMALAAGLNVTTESLGKYTISQIADKDIVDQAKYVSMLKNFAAKYERLKNKVFANYPYTREFNRSIHYWIPIEELP